MRVQQHLRLRSIFFAFSFSVFKALGIADFCLACVASLPNAHPLVACGGSRRPRRILPDDRFHCGMQDSICRRPARSRRGGSDFKLPMKSGGADGHKRPRPPPSMCDTDETRNEHRIFRQQRTHCPKHFVLTHAQLLREVHCCTRPTVIECLEQLVEQRLAGLWPGSSRCSVDFLLMRWLVVRESWRGSGPRAAARPAAAFRAITTLIEIQSGERTIEDKAKLIGGESSM